MPAQKRNSSFFPTDSKKENAEAGHVVCMMIPTSGDHRMANVPAPKCPDEPQRVQGTTCSTTQTDCQREARNRIRNARGFRTSAVELNPNAQCHPRSAGSTNPDWLGAFVIGAARRVVAVTGCVAQLPAARSLNHSKVYLPLHSRRHKPTHIMLSTASKSAAACIMLPNPPATSLDACCTYGARLPSISLRARKSALNPDHMPSGVKAKGAGSSCSSPRRTAGDGPALAMDLTPPLPVSAGRSSPYE